MKPIALLATSLLVAFSFAQVKSAPQKAIEQQIARYDQAMMNKDVNAIGAIMAPGFTSINEKGKVSTQKEMIARVQPILKAATKIVITSKILSFKMVKGEAHLTSVSKIDLDLPKGRTGKTSRIHEESTTAEVWVPAKGSYLVKSSKAIKNKVTLDGKPLPGAGG